MSNVSYRVASSLRISGIAKCALDQHVAVLHCWLRGRCPRWAHRLNTVLIQGCATAWGSLTNELSNLQCTHPRKPHVKPPPYHLRTPHLARTARSPRKI